MSQQAASTERPVMPPPQPFAFKIANPEAGYTYSTAVRPNSLNFKDSKGVSHRIYIPAARSEEFYELVKKESWDELAQFPKWGKSSWIMFFASLQPVNYPCPPLVTSMGGSLTTGECTSLVVKGQSLADLLM